MSYSPSFRTRRLTLAAAAAVSAGLLVPVAASRAANTGTVTLTDVADAYVASDSAERSTNFGTAKQIIVGNNSTQDIGYLKFDLSGLSGYVTSAKIRLYGNYTGTEPKSNGTITPLTSSTWGETTVTYANRPSYTSVISENLVRPISPYDIDFDVTPTIESQIAGGSPGLVSFAVRMYSAPSDGKTYSFNSREAGSNAPELILTFGASPSVKVNFQPDASTVPAGYVKDTGEPYDQGLGFGWVTQESIASGASTHTPLDLTENSIDRALTSVTPEQDTLLYMQYASGEDSDAPSSAVTTPGAWEYAVTPGTYTVTAEVGDQPDPKYGYNSQNQMTFEGKKVINDWVGKDSRKYYAGSRSAVSVTDGRLTIDAIGGSNTKIDDVTITPATVTSPGPTTIKWGTAANLPVEMAECAHVVLDGKIYVFGGYRDATATPDPGVSVYDTASDAWSSLPDMPEGLTHAGFALVGSNLYLAGGYTGQGGSKQTFALTDTWKYNFDSGAWTKFTPLPIARGGGAMVYLNHALHYFGGSDINRADQDTHWMLTLDANGNDAGKGWVQMAAMPTLRNHMEGLALNGKAYIIGGQQYQDAAELPQSVVEVYDPTTDTWSPSAGMPPGRSHIAGCCFTMDNRIIVMGGETDPNGSVNNVDAYNPMTNSWTALTPLPADHRTGFADVVNGIMYYGGGGGSNLTLNTGVFQ